MGKVNVLIGDENVLFVEGLKCLINEHFKDFEICAVAYTGPEILEALQSNNPKLVILNVKMPDLDGLNLIPQIKNEYRETKVIVLSEYDHPKFIKSSFQSGADGYILKSNTLDDFIACIEEVVNGRTFMGDGVSIGPLHRKPALTYQIDWAMEDAFLIRKNLTKREVEILSKIADAKNNKQIASELYISDQTVSVHRKNIMKKLNVSNTASLIKMAHSFGLII